MVKDKKTVSHHPGITDKTADASITNVGVQFFREVAHLGGKKKEQVNLLPEGSATSADSDMWC